MKTIKGLSMALLVLSCLVSQAHAQGAYTLDQVYSKIDQVAKTFRSTQANIERTHVTVLVNDRDVSSGKFYYVRQAKEPRVRLELTKPIEQQLLIDKGKVQIYTPNLKQVQEAPLGEHQGQVEMFMSLGFGQTSEDLKKNFTVSLAGEDTVDGKKTTVLDLKPKSSSTFKSVRLWLDQQLWVSVQIKTTELSDDYLNIKFSDIKMNPKIQDSIFNLNLPKGVTVLKI